MPKAAGNKKQVRVRMAPSPTGLAHIGTARTALFNYLFAKNQSGKFILRIEDTDKERSKKEFETDVFESLRWLGLNWDEGPGVEGGFGPYRQSERLALYTKYLEQLLEQGKAYYCFCKKDDLEAQKQEAQKRGKVFIYNGKCSTITFNEAKKRLEKGEEAVIRFKCPQEKVEFKDLIRNKVVFDSALFGDFIIAKDLQSPLYNFTAVIDDELMQISHVIRGEEHLSNTPKQILLQAALDFEQPEYAHLPMILAENRAKLSKRHGAEPIKNYKSAGYLAEAFLSFIALLGWNPDTNKEIFSLTQLEKEFSLEKVQKSAAIFNQNKLDWLNGWYIRQMSLERLTELCLPYLIKAGLLLPQTSQKDIISGYLKKTFLSTDEFQIISDKKVSLQYVQLAVGLYQERLKKLSEIPDLIDCFFQEPDYSAELLIWKKSDKKTTIQALEKAKEALAGIGPVRGDGASPASNGVGDWNQKKLSDILLKTAGDFDKDKGVMLWPLRVALSGKQNSAPPFDIAAVLGKEKTLNRINLALQKL